MTERYPHWTRTFAFRWFLAFAIHGLVLHVLAGSGTISQVFSVGDHVSGVVIAAIGLFVVLRVYVMLLWPAALISSLAWLQHRACGPRDC